MPTTIQLRRGTTAQHSSFTGAIGEITVDTQLNTIKVHDGSTAGGTRLVVYNEVTDRLQVANANVTFVTKDVAVSSNNAIVALINDRMQVANVSSLVSTEVSNLVDSAPSALNTLNELAAALGDDASFSTTVTNSIGTKAATTYVNAEIGSSNTSIRAFAAATFETKAVALTANTAQNNLINDRIQVANANISFVTKTAAVTGNTGVLNYVNAEIGSSNTSIRAFAAATFETKAVALASNTALINLINDRLQVANAAATYSTLTQLGNTNSYIASVQDNINVQIGSSNTSIRAFANQTYETKAVALTANTAQNNLINDRIQVANAAATYSTLTQLGNTNSYIASVQDNINVQIGSSNTSIRTYTDTTYETKSVALSANNAQNSLILDRLQVANANITFETKAVALAANTAQNNLISDRIQVANAATLFVNVSGDTMSGALAMGSNKITGLGTPTDTADAATKSYVDTEVAGIVNSAPETLNTLNELAAALGDDANFAATTTASLGTKAANTYVNAQIGASNTSIRAFASQTFETKAVALAANTAQNNLISDRIQVANSRVEFLQSANTTVTSGAGSITTTMNQVDLSDEALVNPAGFLTINIGGTDYKLPFYS